MEVNVTVIDLAPLCNCLMVLTTWTSLLKNSSATLFDPGEDDDMEDDIDEGLVDMGVVKIGLL